MLIKYKRILFHLNKGYFYPNYQHISYLILKDKADGKYRYIYDTYTLLAHNIYIYNNTAYFDHTSNSRPFFLHPC